MEVAPAFADVGVFDVVKRGFYASNSGKQGVLISDLNAGRQK